MKTPIFEVVLLRCGAKGSYAGMRSDGLSFSVFTSEVYLQSDGCLERLGVAVALRPSAPVPGIADRPLQPHRRGEEKSRTSSKAKRIGMPGRSGRLSDPIVLVAYLQQNVDWFLRR